MVEDRVEATTMVDLYQGGDLLVPAGSLLTGYVSAVEPATRIDRKGSVTLKITRSRSPGLARRAGVGDEGARRSGLKGEAGSIDAGAGAGAIIGGILGGSQGAVAGILIGGGGVLVAAGQGGGPAGRHGAARALRHRGAARTHTLSDGGA